MKLTRIAFSILAGIVPALAQPIEDAETAVDQSATSIDFSQLVFRFIEQSNPKTMGILPVGWKNVVLEGQKTEYPSIALPNGKTATPRVAPFVIIPTDGKYFLDPGFDATKGNAQENTLGAVLTAYSEQSDALSDKLDALIDGLESALSDEPATVKKAGAVDGN